MKKTVACSVAAVIILASMMTNVQAAAKNTNPGGFQGFLSGCCFGLRTGADYNDIGTGNREFIPWFLVGCCFGVRAQEDYRDGKEWGFRDVCRIIPYIGVIFQIWDGIDIMNSKGRADLRQAYGEMYY